MDPNQSLPPVNPESLEAVSQKDKISEAAGEYWHDHRDGYIRFAVSIVYSIIHFIKNSIINVIHQVLSKD